MAPLVPAERLPRREAPMAHRAPVPPLLATAGRGRYRRRRRRRLCLHGRRLAVAGLVPAQRLVGREGLAADGAPEAELGLLRRRRRPGSRVQSVLRR